MAVQPITPNQQVASGVTCSQCFAYIGMDFAFSMSCTTSGCTFGFSTGGGIELSAILALSNPSFSESTPPANIIAPPQDPANIPLSSYTTLFSSDGFFISYVPAMQVRESHKIVQFILFLLLMCLHTFLVTLPALAYRSQLLELVQLRGLKLSLLYLRRMLQWKSA